MANPDFQSAVSRHQAGDLAGAEALYRQVLTVDPHHTSCLCNLGAILANTNRFAEAAQCYAQCLAIAPGDPDAHYNFGNLYRRVSQWPEAIQEYDACLRLKPDHVGALFNLGIVHANLNHLDVAADCFRRVMQAEPNYADAYNRLGDIHLRAGNAPLAVENFKKYVTLKPNDPRGLNNLGLGLANLGQPEAAIDPLRKAQALKPDYPDAWNTLGLCFDQLGRKDDAEDCYREAVKIKPDFADAWSNLGTNLTEAGRADEAIAALSQAVTAKPKAANIHSNYLLTLNYTSRLTRKQVTEEHRRWASKFAPQGAHAVKPSDRQPDRVLKVGYLSADFRSHTVAGFIEILLGLHDRTHFHITAYANQPREDDRTDRFRKLADQFRNIIALSDDSAADLIRQDQIDILIDLSGHTAGNRLELLARKPAPIQMTVFGYPNTTGLHAVDYRITDAISDPPGMTESLYVEKLLRLECMAWVYQPPENAPPVAELPASKNPFITFGCLNNPAKISEACLETWAKLLAAVPQSKLILLAGQSQRGAARLSDRFEQAGVNRSRLEFAFRLPPADYFAKHHAIDLMLDPFPYNGGVTTCDALWMGVPVLAVTGDSYHSRQGASILTNAGLPDFIAENPDHLIALAKTWAANKDWLADVRKGLRNQMSKSPVVDGKRYVRTLESALRRAWLRFC